jgi:hypothetical protein
VMMNNSEVEEAEEKVRLSAAGKNLLEDLY